MPPLPLPLTLILLLLTFQTSSPLIAESQLSLSPTTICTPTEIKLTFRTTTAIRDNHQVKMNMPGFTNGACDNKRGTDQLDQVLAKRWPAGLWNAYWYEGTVGNAFEESHFLFKPVQGTAGFNAESDITIIVDKFMKIKANCGSTTNSTFVLTDEALKQVVIPYKNRTQMLPLAECYFTDTRVDVKEPREKEWLWITLQFRPAFRMFAGEQITYNLAGLTNSNYTGLTGFNAVKGKGGADQASLAIVKDLRDLACDGQMCFDVFSANWKEGSHIEDFAGFTNSSITLTVRTGKKLFPGNLYIIKLDRDEAKIGSMCSIMEDFDKVTISSDAVRGKVNQTRVGHTDPIGKGCKQLGNCHGHGTCDYCTEQCSCEKWYGHPDDIVGLDIKVDCSQRVCPSGYAWGALPTSDSDGHPLMECSGAGNCDRSRGVCICYPGFGGAKCERRTCPEFQSNICAGHGRCLSIRQLSTMPDALPLSDFTDFYTSGKHYPLYGGGREGNVGAGENTTWDERTLHHCHCDSSWAVGLGSGERQEAEYFGDVCQFKHCPSGNDPLTTADETDCSGVTAAGGKGVGRSGNVCHIECSNRGLCDYGLGLCECFKGFWGSACELQKAFDQPE